MPCCSPSSPYLDLALLPLWFSLLTRLGKVHAMERTHAIIPKNFDIANSASAKYCPTITCPYVTSVTSKIFSIIWWFRPRKPNTFWIHIIKAGHFDHLDHLDPVDHPDHADQPNRFLRFSKKQKMDRKSVCFQKKTQNPPKDWYLFGKRVLFSLHNLAWLWPQHGFD